MITLAAAGGIALIALGLVCTPGPNMLYLVSRSIGQGRRAGLVALAGVGTGLAVYLAVASAGLDRLLQLVPGLYLLVRVAGACYLLWLAWTIVRPGGRAPFAATTLPPERRRRLFARGVVTVLCNPKVALLYASLLPQFVDRPRGEVGWQIAQLGLVQIAVSLSVNGAIVFAAASLARVLARHPAAMRAQRVVTGALLGAFALRLVTESR